MKKKFLITALLVVACVLALCTAISATEYQVSSNDEFNSAYSSASDGDTIVVNADITEDLMFGKSITYVLRANWQPSSWGTFSGGNTEVSIIADGGNFKLQPTNYSGNGMLQQYSDTEGKYVLNLGGINGGTLTYDGTNVTNPRFMFVGGKLDLTWNLLNGARISGFNLTTMNSDVRARIIHATEFNMYEGSKICGNSIPNNSAAFINTKTLNIYGGEICHNYNQNNRNWSTDCGFIYVNGNVNMYGGKIYENLTNANMSKDFYGFIDVTSGNTVGFFGGYIGENYASKNGNITSIFGVANESVTYCYFKNQEFGKALRYEGGSVSLVDGKWVVSDATITEEQLTDPSFNWKGYKGGSDSVVAFFDSNPVVVGNVSLSRYNAIEGYIQGVNLKDAWNNNQGTNKTYSQTGSAYGIPVISEIWSTKENDCGLATALDESTANGYYFAVAHEYAPNDFNCETGNECTVCTYKEAGITHNFIENIVYEKGFFAAGTYTCDCTNEGCLAADKSNSVANIFKWVGYSKSEIKGSYAIMSCFAINHKALNDYNNLAKEKIETYGLVAASKNNTTDGDVLNSPKKVVVDYTNKSYDVFEMKVTGLDDYADTEFFVTAYITVSDKSYYAQNGIFVEALTEAITYNTVK